MPAQVVIKTKIDKFTLLLIIITSFPSIVSILSEPVDFSRTDAPKNNLASSDGAFSIYSSMGTKSLKALRSVSSEDLMMKGSDDGSEDESDVDIVGDPKGYLT